MCLEIGSEEKDKWENTKLKINTQLFLQLTGIDSDVKKGKQTFLQLDRRQSPKYTLVSLCNIFPESQGTYPHF